jgi:hypothetical protein
MDDIIFLALLSSLADQTFVLDKKREENDFPVSAF